jgi:hypothetical protein
MRSRNVLALLALVGAGLVAHRFLGSPRGTEVGVSRQLEGVWTTTSTSHADRFLEIRTDEIIFGQGAEGSASYRILGVLFLGDFDDRTTYVIRYRVEPDGEFEGRLEVLLGSSDLRIANQPDVSWTRRR